METFVIGVVLVVGVLFSVRLVRARRPEVENAEPAHASFAVQMLAMVLSAALAAGLTLVLDGLLA